MEFFIKTFIIQNLLKLSLMKVENFAEKPLENRQLAFISEVKREDESEN